MTTAQTGFADVLIGLQYGDEGKARVVDLIAPNYDVIARFNGGANAGHTIETKAGGKVALNQIPSGIFHSQLTLYIGSGCVINLEKLAAEIEKIEKLGAQLGTPISLKQRLKISSQCSVVQPHHILIDSLIGKSVGTTKNGIGPCYADKALRMNEDRLLNIRLGDLLDNSAKYFQLIKENFKMAGKLYNLSLEKSDQIIDCLRNAFEKIAQYVEPDTLYLQNRVENGAKVLFEGAQSIMLDVTKGSVPYVTSSSTVVAAAYSGGDLSPNFHRKTMGVAKAIMSRVGHGPFVSEFGGKKSETYCMTADGDKPMYGRDVEKKYDVEKLLKADDEFEIGQALRILSGEYGTVSARPRRVGILDLVQLSYAIKMNGVTELILNKCDLLKEFSRTKKGQIPLVTRYELDGGKIDYVPGSTDSYYRTKTVVEWRAGFGEDISGMRDFEKLPGALKDLLKEIEEKTACKIVGIGVGPEREQFVKMTAYAK